MDKKTMEYIFQLNEQKIIINDFFDKKEIYKKLYRKGGWTGKEVLIHIKDSETVAYDRIRRIISEEKPILWYFEQDLWQKNLEYMNQDITLAKNVFLTTRESIIETVEMHLKKHAKKEGVHSRRGAMSLKDQIEFLLWHADKHINHLKKIKL
ncbi:MAG: DinB family protein [Bacteroidota bacterium]